MRQLKSIVVCWAALCLLPVTVLAGGWPKIEGALQNWSGEKQVLLRSTLEDPLLSPLVLELLEMLLEEGFSVLPGEAQAAAQAGLILDLRSTEDSDIVALKRAEDGAIIAFERRSGAVAAEPMAPPVPVAVAAPPAAITVSTMGPVLQSAPLYGPLALSGHPRSLALLAGTELGNLKLALLYDDRLVQYRLEPFGLTELNIFKPRLGSSRALRLDGADLDGDGRRELAALWLEDVQGIYQGTDSAPHSWLLNADLQPLDGPQSGYLRLHDGQALLQKRGPHSPFSGPVLPFSKTNGEWSAAGTPLNWVGGIFASTPLDERRALGFDGQGRLQVLDRQGGRPVPGSLLLQDLGDFAGPGIAVSLETPRYRSGFSKEDQVREEYHALPARLSLAGDGSVYTIRRGRSDGLPLMGKTSGQDRLVRVVRRNQQLLLEEPFPGVDAYILDFALLQQPEGKVQALLLLNDRKDGSGTAHLLIQQGL